MPPAFLFDCSRGAPEDLQKHFQKTFNAVTKGAEVKLQLFSIGPYSYYNSDILDNVSVVIRLIRSRWCFVQGVSLQSDNISTAEALSARAFINDAFDVIAHSLTQSLEEKSKETVQQSLLKCLRSFLKSIVATAKLNEGILFSIKFSRHETCVFFIYLHTLLDLYYHLMILYYLCGPNAENMEELLESIITNLLVIFKVNDSCKEDACSCLNNFWLVIQLIAEKADKAKSLFWSTFNRVMLHEDPIIALSFLKEIANIHRFNSKFEDMGSKSERIVPNYQFLESKFKELLCRSNCESLLTSLKIIEPLICDLWLREGKIEILQIIWDFYSKRLNVSHNTSQDVSALSIVETIDTAMFCPRNCNEDFEMFVGILVFYLKEYPTHWGKIKGRIYSVLGPNKIKDLSDTGIRHVMVLFLTLSSIYFEEIEKKLLAFLANLSKEKKYTIFVWNMYAAVVLKYVRDSRSIEKLAPPILELLQTASTNQKCFHLIKSFIENLESIINHSANMQLHQWLLFGNWLGPYQTVCYFSDLTYSLNVIMLVLDKCSNADSWEFWEDFFKNTMYSNLKQLAVLSNPPAVIGKIAGKLALSYNNIACEAFTYFNSEGISPKIASMFLEVILDSYPDSLILTSQQELIILQSWANICFLTVEPQCELTKKVIKLDIFPPILKDHLKVAIDPMETFLEYLGDNSKALNLDSLKLAEIAFINLDKTLSRYLSNADNDQIVFGIYKYASSAFLNCGNLIYNRNKPVTILTKLVQILLFPMDFVLGKKTLHNFVLNAVKKYWGVFLNAFVKLNTTADPYLERTLRDMILKYLPYFPSTNSPIVDCLQNQQLAQTILEKICQSYFKLPIKESDANLLKALKIVSDVASSTSSVPLFELIVHEMLYGLFEVVIFHSQRSSAIAVIKHITNSPLFPHVKGQFKRTVIEITEKNIALNTINYFQLLSCLAKFVPGDIREVLETVKSHIGNVERLRGISYDRTLRLHLERLEHSLQ